MRVAVLSLCRDRLDYTKHCFGALRKNAGCDYDHFVLDQGSTDGTLAWLRKVAPETGCFSVDRVPENIGIQRGMNRLLDWALQVGDYEVIVKIDNDCELLQPNTLRDVTDAVSDSQALLSPHIMGLRNTPVSIGTFFAGMELIRETQIIGGVFLAAPASIYREGYRFNEDAPAWGTDDSTLCSWWRSQGGRVGYVDRLHANHYLTTEGQWADKPEYFARTQAEGKSVL